MSSTFEALIRPHGVPVLQDPNVPLTRTEPDGRKVDALCWVVDGKILVHPDRWEAFQSWTGAAATAGAVGAR